MSSTTLEKKKHEWREDEEKEDTPLATRTLAKKSVATPALALLFASAFFSHQ
jgi:hypothetical protein